MYTAFSSSNGVLDQYPPKEPTAKNSPSHVTAPPGIKGKLTPFGPSATTNISVQLDHTNSIPFHY